MAQPQNYLSTFWRNTGNYLNEKIIKHAVYENTGERKENDQLNASRSVLEAHLQNLSSQVQKLQAEKLSINETFNASLIKSKEEKTRLETKIKALESTVAQQSENNKLTVAALGEKINDLAEDKRELNNKIYTARKKVTKKRRRRR